MREGGHCRNLVDLDCCCNHHYCHREKERYHGEDYIDFQGLGMEVHHVMIVISKHLVLPDK